LLQEYYRGSGQGVELLMHQGRPLAAFQHKRLREVPVNGGASAFRESVPLEPDLYRHSVRLLEALNWTGLAMVEFKVGTEGPKLMEINGRVWGSLPLAVRSGMDFPARLAELYLYGSPDETPTASRYRVGVRARNLELDMVWIASVLRGKRRYPFLGMPSRRQGLAALLGLLNPASKFDILSLEDPGPGLAEIVKIVGKFRSKLKEAA
jgi:predicted ATP-grasp superfamily ATP-dependent carboligase